jgi:hypothetical protein
MTTSLLRDLLFISNPKVLGLSHYLNQTALMFILPAFYIGLIAEYFNNFDFSGVSKRAVIAFLAIRLLTPLHVEAVDQSLKVSSELLKRYSPQNKFLTAYQQAKGESIETGKKGVWGKLTSIVKMLVDDPIVMIIFLLSYIAFFLLTQLYSLTYHLTIAMIGLCAVLSILPITSGSLKGAVKSSLWCILMPFVVAIILCLIGDSDAFFKTYSGGIVQNLESLIQLFIMTIILLLAPMITSKLMSESGVSQMAENLGQMAAMGALIGGTTVASKYIGAKTSSVGSMLHNSTSRPLMNKVKGAISNKAQSITKDKGLGPSIKTLTSQNPIEKMKGGMADLSDNLKNTSFKEKVVLGADSIINKKENSLARVARLREVNKSNPSASVMGSQKGNEQNSSNGFNKPELRDSKVPLAGFKKEAGHFLKSREELINRPRLSNQFLQQRNSQSKALRANINSLISGNQTGEKSEGKQNWRVRVPKTEIKRSGKNVNRHV